MCSNRFPKKEFRYFPFWRFLIFRSSPSPLLSLSGGEELHIGTPFWVVVNDIGKSFWLKPRGIYSDSAEIVSDGLLRVRQGVAMFHLINEVLAQSSDVLDLDAYNEL